VAIPFIIFFLIKDGREMKKRVISLVPNRYFEFSLHLLHRMDLSLGNFLRGQFLDGLIFGVLATAALWLLHVDYFLFIGCFAGFANLIPYVGPIAGAVLAVMVVMVTSGNLTRVLYVLVAFTCIKLVDDSLIQPLTVAKSVKMHPLLVLLVIIIGGHFFGILGMLLAVPFTGFAKVGYEEGAKLLRKYRHSRVMEPQSSTS
jgi:predicted PurR-regulated permease PerM